MNKATHLIKGGLLISLIIAGLFLLSFLPARADSNIENIRSAVEKYTQEKYGTTTRPFFIDPPMVLEVKDGELTPEQKPLVLGLAPNNTTLRIYIDDILVDSVFVSEEGSQAAIFAYQPSWLLAREVHSVYVRAVSNGALSKPSNRFYFEIGDSAVPQISAVRIEKKDEAIDVSARPVNAVLNFTNYEAPQKNPPTEASGVTKELIFFLVLMIFLLAWVWSESR